MSSSFCSQSSSFLETISTHQFCQHLSSLLFNKSMFFSKTFFFTWALFYLLKATEIQLWGPGWFFFAFAGQVLKDSKSKAIISYFALVLTVVTFKLLYSMFQRNWDFSTNNADETPLKSQLPYHFQSSCEVNSLIGYAHTLCELSLYTLHVLEVSPVHCARHANSSADMPTWKGISEAEELEKYP